MGGGGGGGGMGGGGCNLFVISDAFDVELDRLDDVSQAAEWDFCLATP